MCRQNILQTYLKDSNGSIILQELFGIGVSLKLYCKLELLRGENPAETQAFCDFNQRKPVETPECTKVHGVHIGVFIFYRHTLKIAVAS